MQFSSFTQSAFREANLCSSLKSGLHTRSTRLISEVKKSHNLVLRGEKSHREKSSFILIFSCTFFLGGGGVHFDARENDKG